MTMIMVLTTIFNTLIVSFVVRRLIGVPVGWVRCFFLSLCIGISTTPLLQLVSSLSSVSLDLTPGNVPIEVLLLMLVLVSWILAAEVAILVILEVLIPSGSLPGLGSVRSISSARRRIRRYLTLFSIAVRSGVAAYVGPGHRRVTGADADAHRRIALSLKQAFTMAGVTFVKLGQMISTRPDLVPPAYVEVLSELHSSAPPAPWSHVEPTLVASLGRPLEEVFAEIDEEPMAAASVAQVHRARLIGGEEVVVKIQRPEAREQGLVDMDIILRLAGWLQRTTNWAQSIDVVGLAEGLAVSLREEFDYTVEVENMESIRETMNPADADAVTVPVVHVDHCSDRVLVAQRVPGRPLSDAHDILESLTPEARHHSATTLILTVLRQMMNTGIFHADLHPGNVLIDEEAHLGLVDFGSVGRFDRQSRHALTMLLLSLQREDAPTATTALIELLDRPADLDERRLQRAVGELIVRYAHGSRSGTNELFISLLTLVMKHGFTVPPQVAACFRTLGALERSVQILSPGLDLVATARSLGHHILRDQLNVDSLRSTVEWELMTMLPLLRRLPVRLEKIADDFENGRTRMQVQAFESTSDRDFITGLLHRFTLAVLAAGCAICGILLIIGGSGPMLTPSLRVHELIGFTFLLFGFVIAARTLVVVFRQENRRSARDPRYEPRQ